MGKKFKELLVYMPVLMIAIQKPGVSWLAKLMGMLTIAYALSPLDLIPDFIPVLGYLEDVLILPSLIWITVRVIPKEILQEAKQEVANIDWKAKRSWVYAIPIIILWLAIGYWLYQLIIK